jgi:hypothetical protein
MELYVERDKNKDDNDNDNDNNIPNTETRKMVYNYNIYFIKE